MMHNILGHHHISMLTKDIKENHYFYHDVLGLRRVNITVNQDKPSMYHVFYGDRLGHPGTELSFFEMPLAGRTHRGTNAITKIGLLVSSEESLLYWKARFEEYDVEHGTITKYMNKTALSFEDSEGLRMVLLVSGEDRLENWEPWDESDVPVAHQIQGMGSVEMTVRKPEKLAKTLQELLGYREVLRTTEAVAFQSTQGQVCGEIVVKHLEGATEKPGRGSIHHLAIRVQNEEALQYWEERVRERGLSSSGIIDRFYFKSLYFRESNGILFEIATDGPGFTVNRKPEDLGERLELPPFLEKRRAEIERRLKPIEENE